MLEKLKAELAVLEAAAEKDVAAIEAKAKEIAEWVEKEVEGKKEDPNATTAAGASNASVESTENTNKE